MAFGSSEMFHRIERADTALIQPSARLFTRYHEENGHSSDPLRFSGAI